MKIHHVHSKYSNFTRCGQFGWRKTSDMLKVNCLNCQGTESLIWRVRDIVKGLSREKQRKFFETNQYKVMVFIGQPARFVRTKFGTKLLLLNVRTEDGTYVSDHVWLNDYPHPEFPVKGKHFRFVGTPVWYTNLFNKGYRHAGSSYGLRFVRKCE